MISYPVVDSKDTIKLRGTEMWNLLKKTYTVPSDFEFQYIQVTADYVARPDLLSLHLYSSPSYADVLCKLNGISNPFELNEGMYIVAPNIDYITDFYNVNIETSSSEDSTVDDENTSNVPNMQKKKNEPRKANEQVVGDKNFRIDRSNKIVIY